MLVVADLPHFSLQSRRLVDVQDESSEELQHFNVTGSAEHRHGALSGAAQKVLALNDFIAASVRAFRRRR